MKRILIVGSNSYIGTNFIKWIQQWPNQYDIESISLRSNTWKQKDFSRYDVLLHVAGIAHMKETKSNADLYYKVNRDLTYEVAQKAKRDGARQFIFLSSMSVYGIESEINKEVIINLKTHTEPKTFYGKSKHEAEKQLLKLQNESFKISVIRAPMIYGSNCPGNYSKLRKLVKFIPIFPFVKNNRSMIFIDHLSEFLRLIIETQSCGIYLPQNKEFVNTKRLVELIAKHNNKNVLFSSLFGKVIIIFSFNLDLIKKLFGNLVYEKEISQYNNWNYNKFSFEETIEITEGNWKD